MSPRRLFALLIVFLFGCSRSPQHEFEKGIAYYKEEKFAEAESHFARAIAGAPPTAQALNFLGVCRLEQGKTETAIKDFQEALRLDPGHAAARQNLALAMREASHRESAPPSPTPTRPVEPPPKPPAPKVETPPPVKTPEPVKVVEPAKPAPVVEPPAAPKPEPTPVVKRRAPLSIQTLKAGNRTKAKGYFSDGVTQQQQGKLPAAIASYGKAIAADPSFADPYFNLGIAYRDSRQPERALDNYELALLANPKLTRARINYAILLQQEGYNADALPQYEQVLREIPDDASIHLTLATLYARDRATKDNARQHYQAFLKLTPNSPLARDIRRWLDQNP